MSKTAIIIGSGVGGLAAAGLLAKAGYRVEVFEKNEQVGGRAGVFEAAGFRFDTGPSWYLMPDVFERFFAALDERVEDHLKLARLQPSYRVTFKDYNQQIDIYGDLQRDRQTFEAIEPGAGRQLEKYLDQSSYVYQVAMDNFLYRNYDSVRDFLSLDLIRQARRLSLLKTMDQYVRRYFRDQRLQQVMQYPLVFLGASPYNAPALYNLMSHVDFRQGVYYPKGGMYEVTKALEKIAVKQGAEFRLNQTVEQILVKQGRAVGVQVSGKQYLADLVVSNADPHHTEQSLLSPGQRDHSDKYWQSRTLAPSALLMYLGVGRRYDNLLHHNLLFSKDWRRNFVEIYDRPQFPSDPSMYICAPSRTDPTVAPQGKENLFVLVPLAAGLNYSDTQLDDYAGKILQTIETELQLPGLRESIEYQRLFCVKDFEERFNSLRGTGLGLAHTLRQTAVWRPSNRSRKVNNLYYVGANVHPGIGLPVCLISAQLMMQRLK